MSGIKTDGTARDRRIASAVERVRSEMRGLTTKANRKPRRKGLSAEGRSSSR